MNTASQTIADIANRKMERADIAMLEALEKAPEQTLRWDDTLQSVPFEDAKGNRRNRSEQVLGLQTLVNEWCAENPHLTVIPLKEVVHFNKATNQEVRYTPDPYVQSATIARLEALVGGGVISHEGQPDEQSATKGMRPLRLTRDGQLVLDLWRKGRLPCPAYPDPKSPEEAKAEAKGDGKGKAQAVKP